MAQGERLGHRRSDALGPRESGSEMGQAVSSRPRAGVSVAQGHQATEGAQSFFSRLYISRLLRSPAQVRLLVRNFFRSSLKSSWCMGR